MRSLITSYLMWAGHDHDLVRVRLSLSSISVLLEHYIDEILDLEVTCILPGGPVFPPDW